MVDYITPYSKAIPLQKATSKMIVWEWILLFSRVGIPKDLLTDQSMPFTSKLSINLCRLLQVSHLKTSVYHPEMDRLGEIDPQEHAPKGD